VLGLAAACQGPGRDLHKEGIGVVQRRVEEGEVLRLAQAGQLFQPGGLVRDRVGGELLEAREPLLERPPGQDLHGLPAALEKALDDLGAHHLGRVRQGCDQRRDDEIR
jgi:hypothetical protein